METIVVYSPLKSRTASSRLSYVLNWILRERLQLDYTLTDSEEIANAADFCLSYGADIPNSISIPVAAITDDIVWIESELQECHPADGMWQSLPVLFAIDSSSCSLPFDLLSAVFFLLSRYEEYFSFQADGHGRYPATESILYRQGLLSRPIVDEWVEALRQLMETTWKVSVPQKKFTFLPTYDIDMAYSHANKGIRRIIGAYIRALVRGDLHQIAERIQVLKKKKRDPYDSFAWLHALHVRYGYRPLYFILCALRTTAFDKNIHPQHPAMTRVIKQLDKDGAAGIHPSYFATDAATAGKEKKMLEHITGREVTLSRQHYIKLRVPDTFRMLAGNGIKDDYSMGYGTHLGFRAGTGNSFLWYDLQHEQVAALRVHPFCFMDTTAHYDLRLTCIEGFARLYDMAVRLRDTGSTMITVFHNFSLGTAQEWAGWNEAYEEFLRESVQ